MPKDINFLIIGNLENRRIKYFSDALKKFNINNIKYISYYDLLINKSSLENCLAENTIIRLESPGENFEVTKKILALGENYIDSSKNHSISKKQLINLEEEKGRIYFPWQYYSGLKKLYKIIEKKTTDFRYQKKSIFPFYFNNPEDIIKMFDKTYCNLLFRNNKLNTPETIENIKSYEQLKAVMIKKNMKRVFIKLRTGSSASGVGAFQISKKEELLTTTIELSEKHKKTFLYNSLKIKRYKSTIDIKKIINWLCRENIHVERWIPKMTYNNNSFDIRIIVINKKACHNVIRLSSTPITNLHLLNKRGSFEEINLDFNILKQIEETAINSFSLFKESIYAGLDILLAKNGKPYIIEINAFGDLLPGIIYNNKNTYETELESILNNQRELKCTI